jgi:hypothetical protein
MVDIITYSVLGILIVVGIYYGVHKPVMNSSSCDTPWGHI